MPTNRGGRPRKPDVLHELEGTARPGRQVGGTAVAKGQPVRPEGLSEQAKKIWDTLGPQLSELGLLAEVDASTFATFCQNYGDWLELTAYLNKLGPQNWFFESESGYRQIIPEVAARDKSFQAMQKLAGRFGLDPSSRSGIPAGKPVSADNPVEEFLFAPRLAK